MTVVENQPETTTLLSGKSVTSYSYAGSVLLHFTFLGLLAALAVPGFQAGNNGGLSVSVVNDVDTTVSIPDGLGDSVELSGGFASLAANAEKTESGDASSFEAMTSISDENAVVLQSDEGERSLFSNSEVPAGLAGQIPGTSGKGKAGGRGFGAGSGSGTATGDGTGTGTGRQKFFGIGSKHKSVVFVVDASGSMNRPYPGPAQTRINRVKLELYKTISAMTENDQFYMIFFGDDAIPMPARTMATGGDDSKRFYLTWMAQLPASSQRTMPTNALLRAIALKPEAIYFLTDGEIRTPILAKITKANSTGIPIHTIGFSDNRGEALLREIAEQNNGSYTFIPDENQ